MSNEHKLDTKINPLDERSSHTLIADEFTVTSEENLHSELGSNSSLNISDYEMDNTSESHHESLVIENSGISIVNDTDSVGKYDEVVVEEQRNQKQIPNLQIILLKKKRKRMTHKSHMKFRHRKHIQKTHLMDLVI